MFAGEQFENDADFRLAKSMLLDMFRGRLVDNINLKVCVPRIFASMCTQAGHSSFLTRCCSVQARMQLDHATSGWTAC